jgi:hypothetical protein
MPVLFQWIILILVAVYTPWVFAVLAAGWVVWFVLMCLIPPKKARVERGY